MFGLITIFYIRNHFSHSFAATTSATVAAAAATVQLLNNGIIKRPGKRRTNRKGKEGAANTSRIECYAIKNNKQHLLCLAAFFSRRLSLAFFVVVAVVVVFGRKSSECDNFFLRPREGYAEVSPFPSEIISFQVDSMCARPAYARVSVHTVYASL